MKFKSFHWLSHLGIRATFLYFETAFSIGFVYFSAIFGDFLRRCKIHEIPDRGPKKAEIPMGGPHMPKGISQQ